MTTDEKLENWCAWALGGDSKSKLVNPKAADDYIIDMNIASDIHWKFSRDSLEFDKRFKPGMSIENILALDIYRTSRDEMFIAWERWAEGNNYDTKVIGNKDRFVTNLKSSLKGQAEYKRKLVEGKRLKLWIGTKLKKEPPF